MSRIIPSIMQCVLEGKELPIRSDGTFVRDYVYVGDVVEAYLYLIDHFEKASGEAFNIASDTSLSVLKLIENAERILSTKIRYSIKNTQKNEIPSQHLNWSKISAIGWRPNFSLEMGLLETFGWYKKQEQLSLRTK